MPEREDVLTVVREWVLKAENDSYTNPAGHRSPPVSEPHKPRY